MNYSTGVHVDEEVLLNSLTGISFISESSYDSVIKLIFTSGILTKIIQNFSHNDNFISTTNKLLGNLLSINDDTQEDVKFKIILGIN